MAEICVMCGGKVGFIGGASLTDGTSICNKCLNKIRGEHHLAVRRGWREKDLRDYFQFKEKSEERRTQFLPTIKYGRLCIDLTQKMFCVLDGDKENYSTADVDIYSFEDVRYVDFPLLVRRYGMQFGGYIIALCPYITFATKEKFITVSKPIGEIKEKVNPKNKNLEEGVKQLEELRSVIGTFVTMVECSQPGMQEAWLGTRYCANAARLGQAELKMLCADMVSDEKEIERSKALYQIEEEQLCISRIPEIAGKKVKLLLAFCEGKDTEEARKMKQKIEEAGEYLMRRAICEWR